MTDNSNQKDNNIKDSSIFNDSVRWAHYVSLKGKKLTQGTYLVTSLMPESEPLKWRLRDICLDILSDISVFQPLNNFKQEDFDGRQISPLFKATVLESAVIKIDQLLHWLEISLAGNFSIESNLNLLIEEYTSFNQLLIEKIKATNLNKLVSLEVDDLTQVANSKESQKYLSPDLSHKNKELVLGQNNKEQTSYQKLSHLPHKNRDVAKDSRRSIIVGFLKDKDWTSIKDITEAVGGCSAKTIQRELADLVQRGVLKKKGDRRWSRYLLA